MLFLVYAPSNDDLLFDCFSVNLLSVRSTGISYFGENFGVLPLEK